MAISEKRYAAELIDRQGQVFPFDDLGCMVRFARERGLREQAAFFVLDYETLQWIEAERAVYVRSDSIASPMRHGIIAVGDRRRAEALADRFRGRIGSFADLWTWVP
jgi:copper chaperone NosL